MTLSKNRKNEEKYQGINNLSSDKQGEADATVDPCMEEFENWCSQNLY